MRMVASDLDGTLVREDLTVSARTVAVLAACADRGVDVVFVTGRPPRWMAQIADLTGHRGLAICANGASLYDLVSGEVVRSSPMAADQALIAAEVLRAAMPEAVFALETLSGFRRENEFRPRHAVARLAPAGSLPELLADDPQVLKLLCCSTVRDADAMLALARPLLAGLAEPVHSGASSSMLEISAPGVSKASTLAELAARRGIDRVDVVAFGDMPNDVPMLRWAGIGYAMADGHHEAVAAADAIAPPCHEDGVAQVLERLLD